MNICTECQERGIGLSNIVEDDELWEKYRHLYNCIGYHQYEKAKETDLRFIIKDVIDTTHLIDYCKEHGETELLKRLGKLED